MKLSDLPKVPVYVCQDFGCYIENLKVGENDAGEDVCPRCGGPAKRTGERDAKWFSVAEYYVTRAYGGAEEGGWWYDEGQREDQTLRCYEAGDMPQLILYIEMMKARTHHSANFRIYTEEVAPRSFPDRRPHYC